MDRQIVYPGAIPLETDLLNSNRYAMIGLSKLTAAILGEGDLLNGLACTPVSPAALQVQVAAGEIYGVDNVDSVAYGSLAADTVHSIVKQGLSMDPVTINCPAPATAGYSVDYLVQAAYQDVDVDPVVLPYYNAGNPPQAYSGPDNSGTAQATARQGMCQVKRKTGVAALSGSQTTPAPDVGYIGLYVVTVAASQSAITAADISAYPGAPFIGETLTQKISQASGDARYAAQTSIQDNRYCIADGGGTADAIAASYTPAIAALTHGMTLYVRAAAANLSAAPTYTPNSGAIAAKAIVKGADAPLIPGDIAGAGHWLELQYDATLDRWVLLNPATGVFSTPAGCISCFAMLSPPSGWLEANGSAISRITYATLFSATGTTFGVGDGGTTFNLPDLRGEFVRGWDNGRGIDAGRTFGSAQADDYKSHGHPFDFYVAAGAIADVLPNNYLVWGGISQYYNVANQTVNESVALTGGTETRPRNLALMYCIKY